MLQSRDSPVHVAEGQTQQPFEMSVASLAELRDFQLRQSASISASASAAELHYLKVGLTFIAVLMMEYHVTVKNTETCWKL